MTGLSKRWQYGLIGAWALVLLTTAGLYAGGLGGPFLFDDFGNLAPVRHWLDGRLSLAEVVFGNHSGPFGRSIAMATFALNAAISGPEPSSYKAGNILIHCVAGMAVGWLAFRLSMLDRRDRQRALLFAAVVGATWLLHSSHVTTVLYPVQRMAQLSMLLVVLSLVAFSAGLCEWERNPLRSRLLVFLLFPVLGGFGLLAKENAAVAPLMAIGIYVAFRGRAYSQDRFLGAVVAAAVLLAVFLCLYLLLTQPDALFGVYGAREFTLVERLYTQLLALIDYLSMSVLPAGVGAGLFADDYPVSRGLLSPPATLLSLLVLVALTVVGLLLRGKAPLILAGWLMFLGGHAVEASFLPLELFFEHRNYLPSVGIYVALYGAAALVVDRLLRGGASSARIFFVPMAIYLAILCVSTGLRASAWKDELVLLAMTAEAHPDSYRANAAAFDVAIRRDSAVVARAAVDRMIASEHPRTHALGYMHRVVLDCLTRGSGSASDLARSVALFPRQLTGSDMNAVQQLAIHVVGRCDTPSALDVGSAIEEIVDQSVPKDPRYMPAAFFLTAAAQAYSVAGYNDSAVRLASRAWSDSGNPSHGAFYALMLHRVGRSAEASRVIDVAASRSVDFPHEVREDVMVVKDEIDGGR